MADEKEFYSRLKDEIEEWQRDGIIDNVQAETILKKYAIEKKGYRSGKVITAISTLGSVLVGVGIILFIASNWALIPDPVKVALLLLATFGAYFAGYVMQFEKKSYPRMGHALLFLGSILVGATIFLTGQIFNVSANTHWLLLLWFIAILPMGYVFDSKPTIGLKILVFTLWIIFFITGTRGGLFSYQSILLLFMLFGIALYSLGQIHELTDRFSRFRMLYRGFGIYFILISFLFFSIMPFQEYSYGENRSGTSVQFLFGIFALIAVICIMANLVESEKLRSTRYEFYVLLAAFIGWIGLFILNEYPQFIFMGVEQYGGTYFQLHQYTRILIFAIFNLIFFGLTIGTISIGYYKNEVSFVNAGILFFALGLMQVYVNHFMGMLPTGLGLVIGGIIMLIIATYLEKKRRSLLSAMGGDQ